MIYQFENFSYHYDKGLISKNSDEFKLTKTQKMLLNFFIDNPNKIFSKHELMEQVWDSIVTQNSVDQIIVILRSYLETNPKKPELIITHFGQGLCFETQVPIPQEIITTKNTNHKQTGIIKKGIVITIILLMAFWIKYSFFNKPEFLKPTFSKNMKILVLPTTFTNPDIGTIEKLGAKSLLKSAFSALESEGQILFDQSSLTTQQAIEKHWQRESDLVFLHTSIVKKGNVYQGSIELSDGHNTLEKTTIAAENLGQLLNKQMLIISDLNHAVSKQALNQIIVTSPDEAFVKALGFRNNREIKRAQSLLNEILNKKPNHYLARLTLAEILFEEKKYNKSLSQLNTLKATPAYDLMGTEIEIALAEIKYIKHENNSLINQLKDYQAKHLNISPIKKSKIKLLMAKAYKSLPENKSALNFYQQALHNIDEQLNPLIYAQSYLGQANIQSNQSNSKDVYELYQSAQKYAELAGDLHHQILALNGMSHIALLAYDWEKSISLQKQAIELMELDNNKEQVAVGLGTLVTILNLRGQFKKAKTVNNKLGNIAEELDSDKLRLHFMHFDAILAMNTFDWAHAQKQIDKTLDLALKIGDYGMQLNNAFTALELILLKKDTTSFMQEWNKRSALIQKKGFERFQVYMDLYLARYYKQIEKNHNAINLLEKISEELIVGKDIKMLVDAQNQLAMVYLKSDAKKALAILNNLEQHDPHPNPYLDLKAQALFKLGKHIEALSVLNQAKQVYHESWTSENQVLLETIKKTLD